MTHATLASALFSCALCVVACTRKEPVHSVEASHSSKGKTQTPASPDAAPPKRGPLSLTLSVEKSAGGVGVHVLSKGPETAELAADISIVPAEKGSNAGTERALVLRRSCADTGCVKLAAGGELMAPVWLGTIEGERCDALFVPPAKGEYVLTVRSCDGSQTADTRFFWNAP